jgi:hypothetical protein
MSDSTEQKLHEYSEQLTFKQMDETRPQYKYSIYQPTNGSAEVTLNNSAQITRFELPTTEVFNLGRSNLCYQKYVEQLNEKRNNLFADFHPEIQAMRLTLGAQNTTIVQIENFPEYEQTVLKYETKLEEYLTRGAEEGLFRSNLIATSNYKPSAAGGVTAALHYTEPKYLQIDAVGADNNAGDSYMEVRMPLKNLKNTFFSLDKDVCFAGKQVYLEITWNDKRALGYTSDDLKTDGMYEAEIVAGTECKIQNLSLYLAMEQNMEVAATVKSTADSGMRILTDYVMAESTGQFTGTGRRNIQMRFSTADGHTLKKIYHSIYSTTESGASRYNNSLGNVGLIQGTDFKGFKTMWNNKDRQQGYLYQGNTGSLADGDLTDNMDDWLVMRELCKGSVIQSRQQFLYNWAFCDDYSNIVSVAEKAPVDMRIRQGIKLGDLARWDLIFNASNASYTRHMTWAIVQRVLYISKQGIAWI